jgi:predicted neuraminidase
MILDFFLAIALCSFATDSPQYSAELIFPLHHQHNHASSIVELSNGDLLASWYRGTGERQADDVAVYGARKKKGEAKWSDAFLMADTPGFPDCNTAMMIDKKNRLWLFWPTIIANTWESCLTNYRTSQDFSGPGCPKWDSNGLVLLKPADFSGDAEAELKKLLGKRDTVVSDNWRDELPFDRKKLESKLYQRIGWQPRCKPTVLPSGRILLPLYSDTYSLSIMAISDDEGKTWYASKPLLGFGAIQPAVLRRDNGELVAYMRENGILKHVRTSTSKDEGLTWGPVTMTDMLNPGSGLDGVRLANGHWLLVYNDTISGRNSLVVAISTDEGKTWKSKRHLEKESTGQYHYPSVIQGHDGTIHAVYSYFVKGGQTMKHAAFNEAWVQADKTTKPE